jgi:hypothetical protein
MRANCFKILILFLALQGTAWAQGTTVWPKTEVSKGTTIGNIPGPSTTFTPTSLAFGNQEESTTSSPLTVVLNNYGSQALAISSIALQTGTEFAISANTCGSTVAAYTSCSVSITFTPTGTSTYTDNLQFTDNAAGSPQSVGLSGSGSNMLVISNYQSGISGSYLSEQEVAETSPSLIVNLKTAFRGGNNCAIMAVTSNQSYTQGTPTDNESETWHAGPSISDTGLTLKIWYVLGDTAGTNQITIAMSGTAGSGFIMNLMGATVTEVENCNISSVGGNATLDVSPNGSAQTMTLSAGPTAGDMVWAAFDDTNFDTNNDAGTLVTYDSSITGTTGYTLLSESLSFGKMAEYDTSTTSSSVSVTYPSNTTGQNVLGAALVIKQGSGGNGPPSGMYIDHYEVDQPAGTSPTIHFPCSGNLIVGLVQSSSHATSVTGSTGTWETPGALINTANNAAQIFYGYGASCAATTTVSPTWNAAPTQPGSPLLLASVTNALNTSSVYDTGGTANGSGASATNLTTVTITPSSTNEIIFNVTPISFHTLTGMATDANGHTPTPLLSVNNEDDDTGSSCTASTQPDTLDEDNGSAFFINTSDTTAITFIYTGTQVTGSCTSNPTGVGGWGSVSAAFIP